MTPGESKRNIFLERIKSERENHFDLPGSEWDVKNTVNDWVAIVTSYCSDATMRKHTIKTAEEFEDNMIKAGAVILAALEHIETLKKGGQLK